MNQKKYYQKKIGLKILKKKIWFPEEQNALKELKILLKKELLNYSEGRNFPNIDGTSKLSPFIKFGQIHVETIWNECIKKKSKNNWNNKISS